MSEVRYERFEGSEAAGALDAFAIGAARRG